MLNNRLSAAEAVRKSNIVYLGELTPTGCREAALDVYAAIHTACDAGKYAAKVRINEISTDSAEVLKIELLNQGFYCELVDLGNNSFGYDVQWQHLAN